MTSPQHSRTKLTRRGRWLVLGLATVAAGTFVMGCDDETSHPPRNDIDAGWTCVVQNGMTRAGGTITNPSSKTSFYMIEIAFRVDGELSRSAARRWMTSGPAKRHVSSPSRRTCMIPE